ncbi:MAG: restriction endonuclease subunit S [Syntrophaceae bacterium]|nr:restriction endonuclease subunit S [Syntrophaceae bacterium]
MCDMVLPKTFAVMFNRICHRWDPQSFHGIEWHWTSNVFAPIGSILELRKEKVDRKKCRFSELQPITIHFDGSIDRRILSGNKEYSMDLYRAYPGDIVVAKIDLKNGAVGVIPNDWANVVVTNHFAVYRPDANKLNPNYFLLLTQASFFKGYLWRNKVGAEGRKEVKLDFFENTEIPIPHISIQRAIVNYWQEGQNEIITMDKELKNIQKQSELYITKTLGISSLGNNICQRFFALMWDKVARWDIVFAKNDTNLFSSSKYPTVKLRDVILPLKQTNRRITPARFPDEEFNYVGMENVESITGRIVGFVPQKGKNIKSSSVLFDEEHILYGKLRPYLRKVVAPAVHGLNSGVASSEFIAIKQKEEIDKMYLAEYLRSTIIAEQAKMAIGARMPRVSTNMFLDYKIPLPPFPIQQQIADSLEDFRKKGEIILQKIETNKNIYKQEIELIILGKKKIEDI